MTLNGRQQQKWENLLTRSFIHSSFLSVIYNLFQHSALSEVFCITTVNKLKTGLRVLPRRQTVVLLIYLLKPSASAETVFLLIHERLWIMESTRWQRLLCLSPPADTKAEGAGGHAWEEFWFHAFWWQDELAPRCKQQPVARGLPLVHISSDPSCAMGRAFSSAMREREKMRVRDVNSHERTHVRTQSQSSTAKK